MIDRLFNNPTLVMLERSLSFTEQRHGLLLQDIANVDTPGFVQQDVSVREFQAALRRQIDQRRQSPTGFCDEPVAGQSVDVPASRQPGGVETRPQPVAATPFHDRGVRSPEYLMAQLADNAEAHNFVAQMLRVRYGDLQRAVSMKV